MTLELELDSEMCEVGGQLTGRLIRHADADGAVEESRARSIRLGLHMHTAGRGDTDRSEVVSLIFDLEAHGGLHADFVLLVPANVPVSYDGSLMRIMYDVQARVDLKLARDEKFSRPVVVVPEGGLGVYDRPHPLPMR